MRRAASNESIAGVALSAAAGFTGGLVLGLVAGELLGDLHGERVRRVIRRFRRRGRADASNFSRAVAEALRDSPGTGALDVDARVLDRGLVELAGRVPDVAARRVAADVVRSVPGVELVVNRILVEGRDVPART